MAKQCTKYPMNICKQREKSSSLYVIHVIMKLVLYGKDLQKLPIDKLKLSIPFVTKLAFQFAVDSWDEVLLQTVLIYFEFSTAIKSDGNGNKNRYAFFRLNIGYTLYVVM
jgi:hypothetical protein